MGVSPAGVENQPNTGHHHLLVDATLEGDALKFPIPNDEHHLHFGKGQTETVLTLPPGRHTLQLVLGDWQHLPHEPPVMSERITITVRQARSARRDARGGARRSPGAPGSSGLRPPPIDKQHQRLLGIAGNERSDAAIGAGGEMPRGAIGATPATSPTTPSLA